MEWLYQNFVPYEKWLEWQEDVVFIDLIVWGRQGENSQKYLSKGKKVFIEGRLSQNRWTAQDGTPRNKIEIVAERVQFLSAPDSSAKTEITSEGVKEQLESEEKEDEAFSDDVPF